MTIRRMKEVLSSALNESLCQGCEPEYSDGYKPESCYECRAKVGIEVCDILSELDDLLAEFKRRENEE